MNDSQLNLEELPDLSEFYTDSKLSETAIMETEHPDIEPIMEPTIDVLENRYTDLELIAEGGQKNIFMAKDTQTSRNVAMAIIRDKPSKKQFECNRFIHEARIAANLQHPNIVPIHEIGVTESNKPFFTMKLIKGENLSKIISKVSGDFPGYAEKYDLTELLSIFLKVCDAVAFAHSKGIIHLDLKPENIQVGAYGEVLVLDWGLAKFVDHEKFRPRGSNKDISSTVHRHLAENPQNPKQTINGLVKGTPGYMAPEQAMGDIGAKDKRTDIYSLGAILYSLLTLKRPTVGDTFSDIIRETISGQIIPPSQRVEDCNIPASLEAVTVKAMSVIPEQRYQSVEELSEEISAFIGGFATLAEDASLITQIGLMFKRHKVESSFIIISIITTIISFSLFFHRLSTEKNKLNTALTEMKDSQSALAMAEERIAKNRKREWQLSVEETFSSNSLDLSKWSIRAATSTTEPDSQIVSPSYQVKNGQLNIEQNALNGLIVKQRIDGEIRLEFDIKCTSEPFDFMCFIKSTEFKDSLFKTIWSGYVFTCNSQRNEVAIYRYGSLIKRSKLDMSFTEGETYKIVASKANQQLFFSINGNQLIEAQEEKLFFSDEMNQTGIITKNSVTTIDSVRLYQLGSSIRVDLLKLADKFISKKELEKAEILVNEVITTGSSQDRINLASLKKNRIERLRALTVRVAEYAKRIKAHIPEWNDKAIMIIDDQIDLHLTNLQVKDLDFIRNFELTGLLNLNNNPIEDLEPLKGLRIKNLNLNETEVKSLKNLSLMSLESISLSNTHVTDLEPLRGMGIKHINLINTKINDIKILTTFPLEKIAITPHLMPIGWENILRKCPDLEIIATNSGEYLRGQKSAQFWEKYTAGDYQKENN